MEKMNQMVHFVNFRCHCNIILLIHFYQHHQLQAQYLGLARMCQMTVPVLVIEVKECKKYWEPGQLKTSKASSTFCNWSESQNYPKLFFPHCKWTRPRFILIQTDTNSSGPMTRHLSHLLFGFGLKVPRSEPSKIGVKAPMFYTSPLQPSPSAHLDYSSPAGTSGRKLCVWSRSSPGLAAAATGRCSSGWCLCAWGGTCYLDTFKTLIYFMLQQRHLHRSAVSQPRNTLVKIMKSNVYTWIKDMWFDAKPFSGRTERKKPLLMQSAAFIVYKWSHGCRGTSPSMLLCHYWYQPPTRRLCFQPGGGKACPPAEEQ